MFAAAYPVRVDGTLDRHLSQATPEPCDIR